MNERTAPRSIEQYLADLRAALAGEDPALVQDALYDAEEYLRAEVAANPTRSEADTLELISSTYGAPEEVAEAYRTTEKQVRTALAPPPRKAPSTVFGRFFGVYGDSRTWTALFFMLLSLVTGIFYFTLTVTGLSVSASLVFLIVGIPFFLLFVGFTRVLALAEGRLVEGLLGQRMPRRPVYPAKGIPILERIKQMLLDRRTWTTMFYFLLMLPLGILYFVIATVGICVSIGLIGGSIAGLLLEAGIGSGGFSLDDNQVYFGPSPLVAPLVLICGVL
ncbi:MAG: sensor domain-containing protein, partial [Steroidobacteraceae bacterium]